MKVVMVLTPSLFPPVVISTLQPFRRMRGEVRFRVEVDSRKALRQLDTVDALVFCRNTDVADLHVMAQAQRRGLPCYYVLDDNLLELPPHLEASPLAKPAVQRVLLQFLLRADCVVLYSPIMLERLRPLRTGSVEVMPTYFEVPVGVVPLGKGDERNRVVVFASSRIDDESLESVMADSLKAFLDGRPEWSLAVWRPLKGLSRRSQVRVQEVQGNYSTFLKQLVQLQPAVGLAPLQRDAFYDCKTNNKYREYGGLGIPGIYSDSPVYSDCVRNGANGLLVSNDPDEWAAALEVLATDAERRSSIVHAARTDVESNYQIDKAIESWRRVLGTPVCGDTDWADIVEELTVRIDAPYGRVRVKAASNVVQATGMPVRAVGEQEANLEIRVRPRGDNSCMRWAADVLDLTQVDELPPQVSGAKVIMVRDLAESIDQAAISEADLHPWLPRTIKTHPNVVVIEAGECGSQEWGKALNWAILLGVRPSEARVSSGAYVRLQVAAVRGARAFHRLSWVSSVIIRHALLHPQTVWAIYASRRSVHSELLRWNRTGALEADE